MPAAVAEDVWSTEAQRKLRHNCNTQIYERLPVEGRKPNGAPNDVDIYSRN